MVRAVGGDYGQAIGPCNPAFAFGSMYADYASQNRWKLNQRTDLEEEAPSVDIREWSKNQFVTKVMTEIAVTFQDLCYCSILPPEATFLLWNLE